MKAFSLLLILLVLSTGLVACAQRVMPKDPPGKLVDPNSF